MNIDRFTFSRWLSGRIVLFVLTGMVLTHLVVMVLYTQYSRHTQRELNRTQIIEQMIDVIELVQTTPPKERKATLKNLYVPYLQFSLSKTPTGKHRIPNGALWRLAKDLRKHPQQLQSSYHLPNGEWINFEATSASRGLELQLILILLELVVAGALLFSAWSIQRFTGPLRQFKTAAERLGVDLQSEGFYKDHAAPSIVQETAEAMNKMQARIQELLNNRTKMLAAISHDLRTPITRLKLRAQFMTDQKRYQQTIRDLDEMEQMIGQILSFAKQEFNSESIIKLDLHSLLTALCDDAQDLGHTVEYIGLKQRVAVEGRRLSLKRAFTNLIQNATKYATKVEVDLKIRQKNIIVSISDDGPGIPEQELQEVLQPFYRTDRARSRDTGGVGLGLALTQDIIRAHHGQLTLTNRDSGGLTLTVELPRPE